MSYFPMFIELNKKPCLVVGGGKVALRKVKVLKDFGAEVTVIAPVILQEIQSMLDVACVERPFCAKDARHQELVVAATDDPSLNHRISEICKAAHIPVNAADQQEDCSFIFPAYVKEGEVVAAFSSGGQSPAVVQYLKKEICPVLTPKLGEIANCLGSLREMVKSSIREETDRKQFFQTLLQIGLENDAIPSEAEIQDAIRTYRKEDAVHGTNEKA